MEKRPILHELSLEQIEDLAEQLSRLTDATQIYYFGSRRWDAELSFGLVEFVIVTPNPHRYSAEIQDEIFESFTLNVDALLTFVAREEDVMSRSLLVWPLKS